MSRSLKKKLFISKEFELIFADHVQKFSAEPTKHPLKMQFRSAVILPEHVNYLFDVHNGRKYNSVFVTTEMIGHKFGEFSLTRKLTEKRRNTKITSNRKVVKGKSR